MAPLLVSLLIITSVILTAQCEDIEEGWRNEYRYPLPLYTVSVQYSPDGSKYDHLCTGSIIDAKYILTSASCFDKISDDAKVAVKAGVKEHHDEKGQFINVQKVIVHPSYNKEDPLKKFDVAVLELSDKMKLRAESRVVKLPFKDLVPEGKGQLIGWNGFTSKTQKTVSEKVYVADVSVLSTDDCRKSYPDLTDNQFCIGGVNTPDAPCNGTPGIPFAQPIRGWSLTGLASILPDNCKGPALYTAISPYIDFIQTALANKP